MYSNIRKPGVSIVAQPILPGMLKRDGVDVLPIGYQSVTNWIEVNYDRAIRYPAQTK